MEKKLLSELSRIKEIMSLINEQNVSNRTSQSINTESLPFKNRSEGDKFRQWVNSKYPSYAKEINLDVSGPHNNSYIIKAYQKYGKEYAKYNVSDDKNVIKDHFVFYFSFPEYEPAYDDSTGWIEKGLDWIRSKYPGMFSSFLGSKGTYGPRGHAGVALINSAGIIDIFEFGRYQGVKKGLGVTKHSRTRGAKIVNGNIDNLQSVCSLIKNNTQGKAKNYTMLGVAVPITNEGYINGMQHAKSVTTKNYEIFDFDTGDKDANCATFGLEVVRAATGSGVEYCLPTPGAGLNIVKTYRGSKTTKC